MRKGIGLVLAAVMAFNTGCAMDAAPTAPPEQPSASLIGGLVGTVTGTLRSVTGLLTCTLLRQESRSETIGSNGGSIKVGPHRLEIPRGALSRNTRITAKIAAGSKVGVEFSPKGLQFAKSAKLTLRYDHCSRLPRSPFVTVYIGDDGRILEFPRSRDYRDYEYVESWIDHFSAYAIAY